MNSPQIVWLRRDLRLCDHQALTAAAEAGPVIPVYVLDDETPEARRMGGASRWWLHHSLEALAGDLGRHRSQLVLRRGRAADVLAGLAEETGAGAVHAIRHYEPWWREAEEELSERVTLCLHDGNYLLPPGTVTTGSGNPYKIYSPFRDAMREAIDGFDIIPEPSLSGPDAWPEGDDLTDWGLLPAKPDWAGGMREFWDGQFGMAAATERFDRFLGVVKDYGEDRNLPAEDGTSRMSPHLHHGEVSPRMLWNAMSRHTNAGANTFRNELIWRDYAQNVIQQFPRYAEEPYRDGYDDNFWRNPDRGHLIADELQAWQQGRTGYPIVDAGMRQLWNAGWMHNRVRMIAASFLVKHLLIDWRHGEQWYWDCLVDADYGNNGVNWQWISGTGVDSNMFVRIMAPLSQSEKFDAADYIREWVPELADLSDTQIHDPDDGCRPKDYPAKIIGHKEARERALETYRSSKR
ncbi:deoxyribodipyrimidine photo-lyase [Erythrobacter arachoides]|uniref:Deoxyribodipyrimidine photo-lyase n=1 Tax=Aurantiacibacter arachoides TaxID=1850444 RepID=A0A844ZZS0_9SPHN|nr:deoxyribodipyrimidine photo-lyase [Aurantiacibacter arachoides]MXO93395.1 deoxyribodipyrimidine photo-lyase [Aurantiacibacter arachoides]GGD49697.1 deoxyribodipyrimidine photo-lyase [Aurantiacibacter arachoides]